MLKHKGPKETCTKGFLLRKYRLSDAEEMAETEFRPFQFDIENAVTILKEVAEHRGCSVPKYE